MIADVLERLVVDRVGHLGVLDQLVHGQRRVVRLDDGARDLRGRNHRVRRHDSVRVLLLQLADQQRTQATASAASDRVAQLEALQTVTALGLLAHHIQNGVHDFRALRVVALRPVVTWLWRCGERRLARWSRLSLSWGINRASEKLSEESTLRRTLTGTVVRVDEVVLLEQRSIRTASDRIHDAWLEIHLDTARHPAIILW